MKLYLFSFFSLLFFVGLSQVDIQNSVFASAGDTFTSSNFSLDNTIGETVTQYVVASNNVLSQGFNQPIRKKAFLDAEPIENLFVEQLNNLEINVYPNPFNSSIYIVHSYHGNLNAQIIDVSGRVIYEIIISGSSTVLSLEHLSFGLYHLILSDDKTFNKRINIIKSI